MRFEYAVYLLPASSAAPIKNPSAVLDELLAVKYPGLKRIAEIPKEPKERLVSAFTQDRVSEKYAAPSVDSILTFGHDITQQQAQQLQKSQKAFILRFGHPRNDVWSALHVADSLAEDLARTTGGMVWDNETREMFSPDAWHKARLEPWVDAAAVPDISREIVLHIYRHGGFDRAISLGMTKMGLPDVVVTGFPTSSSSAVGNLINLYAQSLAEGAALDRSGLFLLDLNSIKNSSARTWPSLKSNATGIAYLTVKRGTREDGDPGNQLIELSADRYPGNDLHQKQDRMLDCFFGWEDSIARISHTDELLDASRSALANLPKLREAFNAGLKPGEYIQVKARFGTPGGGNEWMWVEVINWKGRNITGILSNEPADIPYLHSGQQLEVHEEDLFDYIHEFPDGKKEGNTTGQILRRAEEAARTAKESIQPTSQLSACKLD